MGPECGALTPRTADRLLEAEMLDDVINLWYVNILRRKSVIWGLAKAKGSAPMDKNFDPKKIDAIYTLTSSAKENTREGALNAAMANLSKALQFYLSTPMLKKEKEHLEEEFYDILLRISKHQKFAETYGPVSFRQGEHKENLDFLNQLIQFGAETIQEKIDQGLELLNAERLDEARGLFWEVVDDPDARLEHLIAIGDGYLKTNRWKEAQDVFCAATKRWPDSINLLNRAAIAYRKDKNFDQALGLYKKAIKLSPKDEGLYYNVARLFLDMGKPDTAGQALRKSLALNPKFQPAAKLLVGVQELLTRADTEPLEACLEVAADTEPEGCAPAAAEPQE